MVVFVVRVRVPGVGVTMFDVLGIKARRALVAVKAELFELANDHASAKAVISAQQSQLSLLRKLAGTLRARISSHGALDCEVEFVKECCDIYENGKMISERKFKMRMNEINEMRKKVGN